MAEPDATKRFFKRARLLVLNSILGVLLFALANRFLEPPMPVLSWPLLLAVLFGLPGALAAILVWVLIR